MIKTDNGDFSPFYPAFPELSNKEIDTAMWLYMRFLPKNIASLRGIRTDSVQKQLGNIMEKLQVHSKVELEAVIARRVLIFALCPGALVKI
ncbi:LuxR C-terminal-related transcriptional regulator [Arsenophonus sp. ENCA]|uniref:helix-turn-helix transcriptional regulator n=1 Tax=Arsenophonus sp. ENCA TaxID=1987579 RepID=UPI0025B936A8|nr:LuxR C-terminal-related transcriptional regulator [Arsenophonus sp. ENCA]